MSTTPTNKTQGFQKTERIEAPMGGPGRGPMGGGMVAQKAMTFGPSAKRLVSQMRPDRTKAIAVVVVAQRVSSIRDADLILVLEDGRVVGRGTHHELLAECETYQEIVSSQMSAEEAA